MRTFLLFSLLWAWLLQPVQASSFLANPLPDHSPAGNPAAAGGIDLARPVGALLILLASALLQLSRQALEKIPSATQQQLDNNLALMAEMGASATPAIFYQDENGRLRQQLGAPRPDVLEQIMGPRS